MENARTVGAVHTHTHTSVNLINKINSIKNNALLDIYARDE